MLEALLGLFGIGLDAAPPDPDTQLARGEFPCFGNQVANDRPGRMQREVFGAVDQHPGASGTDLAAEQGHSDPGESTPQGVGKPDLAVGRPPGESERRPYLGGRSGERVPVAVPFGRTGRA